MSTLNTTNLKNPSSGSNNIVLNTDGSTTVPTLSSTNITGTTIQGTIKSGTAVASTSGSSIDFTGIPSWAKRVTLMLDDVSINGTSAIFVRIGDSGGIEDTGYSSSWINAYDTVIGLTYSDNGFFLTVSGGGTSAANLLCGVLTLTLLNPATNTWTATWSAGPDSESITARFVTGTGRKSLSAALDRVSVQAGASTFDAGTINILYEG